MRVALYARVSTKDQTIANQVRELEAVAAQRGWEIVGKPYTDTGISGTKGRHKRPGLDALLKAVTQGKVNLVAAWSVDRIARSMDHLVDFLRELQACKVDLYLHKQGFDTTTPTGRAMLQMAGVFAELERELIHERIMAGLERAKAEGKTFGRPKVEIKRPDLTRDILRLRGQNMGKLKIARQLNCGVSTVMRVVSAWESYGKPPLANPVAVPAPFVIQALPNVDVLERATLRVFGADIPLSEAERRRQNMEIVKDL